jgi:RNA polymerase sigma-70 factor (ECF subfamily)
LGTKPVVGDSYKGEDGVWESDEAEFARLVELHHGPLYRFALSLTRTETAASDLVQETFLAWAEKGHQLRDRSRARSWLFTTLHRQYLQGQRRAVRFPEVGMEAVGEDDYRVEAGVVGRLDAQGVVAALGRLEEDYRAPLSLCYLEDCTYEEIAAILGIPLGTVKSRISRGLGQLKRLVLGEAGKGGQ